MVDLTAGFSDELLETQVSCRHLIDISPDAILIHHHDRLVLVNEECMRLFGVAHRDELLGRSPFDLVPPEMKEFLQDRHDQVIHQKSHVPLAEITIIRYDGTTTPVETLAIPVPRSDGSTAVLVVLRDISERKRAIEDRLKSESQIKAILNTAMDGIISINEQQEIFLFNGAAGTIFGWDPDQALGRPIDILIPKRFLASHHHDVEQFGRGAIPNRRMGVQRTVMAIRASGEEFPIEASISHATVEGKRIYTIIVRDVSEAVRQRRQIEQQAEMLNQVSDAVSIVDLNGCITFWNRAASQLFGWSAEEMFGRNAFELLDQSDPDVLAEILRATNERQSWSGELTKTNRSGASVIVDHRRTLLRDEIGGIKGYLCIDIDISLRKKQDRLSLRSQRLESIGTLAGGIAHDLNNVLTPILMGAKLLSTDRGAANRQELLDTMVASAQRGAGLVRQLLSFAGGIQGERSPVRIDVIIAETRALLEHTLPKSIQIETAVLTDCPAVLGDTTELAQILMNLCINARDAMPDGGVLTIEAEPILLNGSSIQLHPDAHSGLYVLIKVTDTGTGMGPEVLDRIFDPFFTTKEIGKGTGLGLATVQGIVKSHGGFVNVYSERGCGSKFSVYLPAAPLPDKSINQTNRITTGLGQGQLLLLIDDEPMILQVTTAALEGAGYQVISTSDGEAALATYVERKDEIEVVLLDLMMPGLDGLQVLDRLLNLNPRVKVIACSGLRTAQRETEVIKRGAKAFLPKPYSDDQLIRLLFQILKPEIQSGTA